MAPRIAATATVGRLGALAVVLGVCAAVATGPAVAWAETPDGAGSSEAGTAQPAEPGGHAESDTDAASLNDTVTTSGDKADDSDPGSGADEDDSLSDVLDKTDADGDEPGADTATDPTVPDADSGDIEVPDDTEAPDDAGTRALDGGADDVTTARKKSAPAEPAVSAPRLATGSTLPDTSSKPVVQDLVQSTRSTLVAVKDVIDDVPQRTAAVLASVGDVVNAPAIAVMSSAARGTDTQRSAVATERPVASRVVASVLAAVGFAPLAANGPAVPVQTPSLWALFAWVRREFERVINPAGAAVAQPGVLAAAVVNPLPTSLDSTPIGWVTGQNNGEDWPQTNNTAGFNIYGTDLGILWENGLTGKIQLAFGDTFSGPNMQGDWRSNVLLLSTDTDLSDGLSLLQTGPAYQFISRAPSALFLNGLIPQLTSEVTVIPTSAVSLLDEQYVNYMSVKSWDSPGYWTTNYSAISTYDQASDKWVLVPSTIRSAGWFRSSTRYVAGSQNFQQAAYVLEPEDQVAEGETRYLYAFGTPAGRQGSAYLSRVAEGDVTDLSKYEYWDGDTWVVNNPAAAAPVIGDSTKDPRPIYGLIVDWANDPNNFGGYFAGLFGAKQGGNVSEMSVQYNEYLDKYVVLYADGNNDIQMRLADEPEGPWTDPITIATSADYPGLYAPMIHPWSGTGKLTHDGDADVSNLYWNMSIWGDYNVVLMQTDLSPLRTV